MTFEAHAELPEDLGPWVVVANIVRTPRGGPDPDETYYGTRVFRPGAKVYVGLLEQGTLMQVGVVGQNRTTKRHSACMIGVHLLENLRSKVIYNRHVLQTLLNHDFMREQPVLAKGAGRMCLFKTEDACEAMRRTLEDLIA